VRVICKTAFFWCRSLSSVYIAADSELSTIKKGAFIGYRCLGSIDLFPLKFEVIESEISSKQRNRIRVSVAKHIELVFCSTKRSAVSHITQIRSSNLRSKSGLAISINLPIIMIRLRNAV
jgi:hypothetical protein